MTKFVRRDGLDGTVVNAKTILTNPMKTCDLIKMVIVFWQVVAINILPHVGHHSVLLSNAVYTLWKYFLARESTYHPSFSTICGGTGTKKELD